jgi:hypothetical protein
LETESASCHCHQRESGLRTGTRMGCRAVTPAVDAIRIGGAG